MASTSSGSSSTRSTRRPRKKADAAESNTPEKDSSMNDSNDNDDFGAGVVDDQEQAKPVRRTRRKKVVDEAETEAAPKKPRRKTTRKKVEKKEEVAEAPEAAESDSFAEEEAPRRRPRRTRRRRDDDEMDDSNSASRENDDSPSMNEGDDFGDEDSRDEGDYRPRRRRRRNNNNNNNQGRGRDNNQRGGRDNQRGGYNNQRGRRGNNGGNQRPRRQSSVSISSRRNVPDIEGTLEGVLELHPKGYGFIRARDNDYQAQESDTFVHSAMVEKFNLREGILIRGEVGPGSRGQGPRLKEIETIDGKTVDEYMEIKSFDELTPINPFEQIKLETGPSPVTMRVMDLLTPIGKGQRSLIVAPPRSGKTMLLQDIANAVSKNHPEVHLIVLLIDERPEEVTEMRRLVNGDVIASSMDRDVESHVRTSQLIIERGKRIAEAGGDCFILLDSITRTARAFNKWVGNSGRTMSGGIDIKAMDIPKKMFGTARRFDEGGSLTVAGTALIDTGSQMDQVIFQEFKGTGNMELVLSRDLADRRIWPAIDITKSGTRREEKLLSPEAMESVTMLRRSLISMSPLEAMEQLIRILAKYPTNEEFLQKVKAIL